MTTQMTHRFPCSAQIRWLPLFVLLAASASPAQAQSDDNAATGEANPFLGESPSAPRSPTGGTETSCDDGSDNDGDSMLDCADSDCRDDEACQQDGGPENTNERCSDWIDNDGNGFTDCDDVACERANIDVCRGSWDKRLDTAEQQPVQSLPQVDDGESFEDVLGTNGDIDGERNDRACSDGMDNDGDGFTDCADLGCRYSPEVSVCRDKSGMRFSVVGRLAHSYDLEREQSDTRFTRLQLRALGQIPGVQDSFFLINMRAERTPRLTFAMFQVPIGGGHYLNLNSGGGALSTALIISTSKQLLLEPAYLLLRAFEQNNGAAMEFFGPMPFTPPGKVFYRLFAAGGSGQFNGNVGGRFFNEDLTNYTYSAGGQVELQLLGYFDRFDTPFLYTPTSTAFVLRVGGRYDQRAQERFAAGNISAIFRSNRLHLLAENYTKREFEFGSTQLAYKVEAGVLIVPKWLMVAADYSQYRAGEIDRLDLVSRDLATDLVDAYQWRAAAHFYFYRNVGILTLLYDEEHTDDVDPQDPKRVRRELSLQAQYRF